MFDSKIYCTMGKGPGSPGILSLAREQYFMHITYFLTKTFLGTYIDHFQFTLSPVVILLSLNNYPRYLKDILKISLIMK